MGEAKKRANGAVITHSEPMIVDNPGGRIHVQWDQDASATPNGQLSFFTEFLHTAGLYEACVQDCPLHFTSPNAPTKYDVLGTLLLSILAGHNRYSHITALRCDGVSPDVLKMNKIISIHAMRRGLGRIESSASEVWLKAHIMRSLSTALNTPWILEIDTTIKVLYGHQQGAEVGYNLHKLGRPSHALHTYWFGNFRMVLVQAIAQLYRDRADCENGFDELKIKWSWGGFSTQDIERSQTSARSVALIYNWRSWYCRAAKPDGRIEAITSRPLLLAGVGRVVNTRDSARYI
jgi:hypothetical protein